MQTISQDSSFSKACVYYAPITDALLKDARSLVVLFVNPAMLQPKTRQALSMQHVPQVRVSHSGLFRFRPDAQQGADWHSVSPSSRWRGHLGEHHTAEAQRRIRKPTQTRKVPALPVVFPVGSTGAKEVPWCGNLVSASVGRKCVNAFRFAAVSKSHASRYLLSNDQPNVRGSDGSTERAL